jgi:glycoprotein 2-beta-D-xylosyltransferase
VFLLVLVNVISNAFIFLWPSKHGTIFALHPGEIGPMHLVVPRIPGNWSFERMMENQGNSTRKIVTSDVFKKLYLERVATDVKNTRVGGGKGIKTTTISLVGKASNTVKLKRGFGFDYLPSPAERPLLYRKWLERPGRYCNGMFTVYGSGDVIELHDVVIDTKLATGNPGGESLEKVLSQTEEQEFYKYSKGFHVLPCDPDYQDPRAKNHIREWQRTILGDKSRYEKFQNVTYISGLTIAITRYEYANVYWTLIDFYTVYLVTRFYNVHPKLINILIIDGHPLSSLDPLWPSAFKSVLRLKDLGKASKFEKLVWGMDRGKTPLIVRQKTVPILPEFRSFMLKSNDLPMNHTRDCQRLNIIFVWRRDYINHPRNPAGIISRKITNERELVFAVKNAHPKFRVTEILLETMTVRQQLNAFARADVLIGMHGAGFAQCIFLQPGSAVIEFFPKNFGENWHFEYLAKWSGVHYLKWRNTESANEDTQRKSTKIPPHIVMENLQTVMGKMCP